MTMGISVGIDCLHNRAALAWITPTGKGSAGLARSCRCGIGFEKLGKYTELRGDSWLASLSVRSRSLFFPNSSSSSRRRRSAVCSAADQITKEFGETELGSRERPFTETAPADDGKVEYNWEEQWYPLYLTKEVPKDAPLGLTVFDRSLVVFYDGDGKLNCLLDRCPHRAAKLSEGQLMDGRLECLYHGWQFQGNGACAKIPQLAPGAKIPKQACARSYALKDSQGVLWVWLADPRTAPYEKVPYFEHYDSPGWKDFSAVHELPYDHSVLLENLMDPAHIPISHDRTDASAKRELAQAMVFKVTERTAEGFAGFWNNITTPEVVNFTRFRAPCVAYNEVKRTLPGGVEVHFSATILSRSAGQGKSMLIIRFANSRSDGKATASWLDRVPKWLIHSTSSTVFEQDMGFLSSQNEVLIKENKPTKDIYLIVRSQDVWVEEYRKWLDKVGHGMPYYYGHRTLSPAPISALEEGAPAGLAASIAATYPSKGAFGHRYARDPTSRYFRHVIHCKACRTALNNFEKVQKASVVAGLLSGLFATVMSKPVYRVALVILAVLMGAAYYACSVGIAKITENYVRPHRKAL